ncbi:GNAT family N-acetyltransferase [Paenibacillus harenae]|uniref:GNAT family N-acetyltransferase n=1 Tax=Paenibacillus harenae TaxID=306543 RepID=UPI0027901348|nr:GNAT family N-acetyltransferase [Paenibacillus harenae]MDQ0059877.1 putative acetyltransferase [Paenibacillus harenae]
MEIKIDNVTDKRVIALINEHLQGMWANTPPESVHALGLEELRKPDITFWCAWEGDELLGCGAIKELDSKHGEIKSMRTSSAHLRKGVAKNILVRMIETAEARGYERLSLETGSTPDFEPARTLYEHLGFRYCGPFADYTEDPLSSYMTKEL